MDRGLVDRQVGELYAKFAKADEEFGDAPQKYEEFIGRLIERFQ
jgi:hypothetical protein